MTPLHIEPTAKLNSREWNDLLGFLPSPEQEDAITAPLAPARIVAGAGTGKTTVMAARIAWLILTGQITPEAALGLTFTTKAAAELAQRVRQLLPRVNKMLGVDPANESLGTPTIATYNAFGAHLLREHALRIGIEPDSRVVVDALKFQLGFRVVANTTIDLGAVGYTPANALTHMMELDQALANYLVDPQVVVEGELERIAKYNTDEVTDFQRRMVEASKKRVELAELVSEYRQAKIDYDLIDYSDQIRLAATAAQASSTMRALLREQYSVVLLDEYQDTSIAQKVLLTTLFGDGFPVMAVGDPCQAIYRWRGAEITNMDRFPTDFPEIDGASVTPARTFPLTVNRRSAEVILQGANSISAPLRAIHTGVGELVAGRTDLPPARLEVALFETFADEVRWITKQFVDLGQTVPWENMAVLMRDKKNIATVVRSFEDAGIPVQVADAGALFALPEVREVISYLQILADPTANPSLVRILAGPRWRVGTSDLKKLGDQASRLATDRTETSELAIELQLDHIVASSDRAERVCLLDAMEQAESSSVAYSAEALERFALLSAELRELRSHIGEPLAELVSRLIRVTGLGVEAMVRTLPNGSSRYDRLAMLLDLVSGFQDIDGRMSLDAFLSYVRDNDRFGEAVSAELPRTLQAVTVMSMHKSKGLEFPVVALPGWTKGVFPSAVADDYWPHNPQVMPPHYNPVRDDEELLAFPATIENFDQDFDAHKAHVRALGELDERRLAYVALTRAQHTALVCGSWWGSTQSRRRGPSDFLTQLRESATSVVEWFSDPGTQAKNPALVARVHPVWPKHGNEIRAQLAEQRDILSSTAAIEQLSAQELAQVQSWDNDIAAVKEQVMRAASQSRTVRLPASLSASQLIALGKNPAEFLEALIRPMPRKPSVAADRGVAFHAWLESFYAKPGMFNPEDLPGAGDDSIYSDDQLEQLKESFGQGLFASRAPHFMELPFALVVGGRTIRGRIDAVFTGSIDNASDESRWLIVDWKTGSQGNSDPLQLHIYRHAWAQIHGIEPTQIDAAFYYVSEKVLDVVEPSVSFRDIELALLGGREFTDHE